MIAETLPLSRELASEHPGLQIWRIDLRQGIDPADLHWLDAHEREQAARFVMPIHRHRYTVAHLTMRQLMAQACDRHPSELVFARGEHGKPGLSFSGAEWGPLAQPAFNLSHSDDVALLAWHPDGGEWGVDIEVLRVLPDAKLVAERVYTHLERQEWLALGTDRQAEGFLRLWTRKEACLKAIGSGLSVAPDRFAAGLGAENSGGAVTLPDARGVTRQVRVWNLPLPGHAEQEVAAVARCIV